MKRIACFLLASVLLLSLMGCGASAPTGSNLLAQASPDTSALTLYRYDGGEVVSRTIYDKDQEQKLLDRINALPAQPVEEPDLTAWTMPCYGLWISSQAGEGLYVAWSEGLWLDQDGNVWQIDADFPAYWEELEGADEETGLTVLNFPNSVLLAPNDDRFIFATAEKVNPVFYGNPDEGISNLPLEMYMTVQSVTGGVATVLIDNQSGYEMSYDEYYSLQMDRNGQWCQLPMKGDVGFNDIAYVLQDLEQATVTCDLNIFGELSAGRYRLVKSDMYAEFSLDEEGNLVDNGTLPDFPAEDTEDDVTMTIVESDAKGARIQLTNNSQEDTGYLWDFSLWKQEGEDWSSVPFLESYGICGVADPLPAGETVELSLDFEALFGELESGKYRLLMESEGWSAEFEINNET